MPDDGPSTGFGSGHTTEPPFMRTLNLLLIERSDADSAEVLRCLADSRFDVRVTRINSAAEFDAAIEEGDWDFIISEFQVPGLNAIDAFASLRHGGRYTPFLIISDVGTEDAAVASITAGIDSFLSKDQLGRLVPLIERGLRNAAIRQAQQMAEDALRQSEERYRMLAETASDAILTIDGESTILFVNEAAERIFGYSAGEMLGQKLTMLMHLSDHDGHMNGVDNFIDNGTKKL
ncbi:MAG TPA: PAS domain S-box protein, partial [Pyrinomonadaceae bacterium]|nr:PAS domain S-box protein [Pyrinomonadaceae bacterium]